MMSKRATLSVAIGLALAAMTTTAWAQQSGGQRTGFYFGVTGGEAQADLDKQELDGYLYRSIPGATIISGSSSLDDSDTSLSLFGGYRFSRHLALEAGYVDFGTAEYRAVDMVDPFGPLPAEELTFTSDFEVKGFTAAVIGTLPLGEMFDLHARLGVLFADTKFTDTAAVGTFYDRRRDTSKSQDLFYGLGAGLLLGQHWAFSLDWQQYQDVGDVGETGETNIDRVSLGVIFRL